MVVEGEAVPLDRKAEGWKDERLLSWVGSPGERQGGARTVGNTLKGKYGGGRRHRTWRLPDF